MHLGGHNVASEALAAGVPQLVLSVDIEKHLTGAALEKAGVARWIEGHHPEPQIALDLISQLCSDHSLARRAELVGREHRIPSCTRSARPFRTTIFASSVLIEDQRIPSVL